MERVTSVFGSIAEKYPTYRDSKIKVPSKYATFFYFNIIKNLSRNG